MLTQIKNLTMKADGRYAEDEELQFLEDYLNSVEQRINTYEKIRDSEEEIIRQVEEVAKATNPYIFHKGSEDFSQICERDRRQTLRCLTAAMLMDDLENLKNMLLIWQMTIVKVFNNEHPSMITYQTVGEVMAKYLTKEEMDLIKPAIQAVQSILS